MNRRYAVVFCLVALIGLFAPLACKGSRPSTDGASPANKSDSESFGPVDVLLTSLRELVRPQSLRGVETVRGSNDKYVFAGILNDYWSLKQFRSIYRFKSDIWLINSDGTGLQRLTDDGMSSDPQWSPSGDEIAFASQGSIKILNPTSKEVRTVLEAYLADYPDDRDNSYQYVINDEPRWAPNGKALAVRAGDGATVWIRIVASQGNEICHFAKGITDYRWNEQSGLEIGYGRFDFDWGDGDSARPCEGEAGDIECVEIPDPVEDDEVFLAAMLKKLKALGVVEIKDHARSPSDEMVVLVGELKDGNNRDGPGTDLWLVDRDGRRLQRLTSDGSSSAPVWSPSGRHIALVSRGSVALLDINTLEIRETDLHARVPRDDEDWPEVVDYAEPQWSPNGKLLAALGDRYSERRIRVVDVESGNEVFEAHKSGVNHFINARWTTSSELVVSYGKLVIDGAKLSALQVISSESTGRRFDTLRRKVTRYGVVRVREYSESPDGKTIVFVGESEKTWRFVPIQVFRPQTDIWLIRSNLSGLRRLTRDGLSYDPAWSSTGKELAFVKEGSVCVLEIRTGRVRRLAGLRGERPYTWECDYHEYRRPRWSPNLKAISAESSNGCGGGGLAVAEARSGRGLFMIGNDETPHYEWDEDSTLRPEGSRAIHIDWEAVPGLAQPKKER